MLLFVRDQIELVMKGREDVFDSPSALECQRVREEDEGEERGRKGDKRDENGIRLLYDLVKRLI